MLLFFPYKCLCFIDYTCVQSYTSHIDGLRSLGDVARGSLLPHWIYSSHTEFISPTLKFASPTLRFVSPTLTFYFSLETECTYLECPQCNGCYYRSLKTSKSVEKLFGKNPERLVCRYSLQVSKAMSGYNYPKISVARSCMYPRDCRV